MKFSSLLRVLGCTPSSCFTIYTTDARVVMGELRTALGAMWNCTNLYVKEIYMYTGVPAEEVSFYIGCTTRKVNPKIRVEDIVDICLYMLAFDAINKGTMRKSMADDVMRSLDDLMELYTDANVSTKKKVEELRDAFNSRFKK